MCHFPQHTHTPCSRDTYVRLLLPMLIYWLVSGIGWYTDPNSIHSGCPVLKGEKWSATKWMRQKMTFWLLLFGFGRYREILFFLYSVQLSFWRWKEHFGKYDKYSLHIIIPDVLGQGSKIETLDVLVGRPPFWTGLPFMCVENRDGIRGCGCGFRENLSAGKPAGLGKIRPQADPRVPFCTRTRTRGFRVPAGAATNIIKMHKFINLKI